MIIGKRSTTTAPSHGNAFLRGLAYEITMLDLDKVELEERCRLAGLLNETIKHTAHEKDLYQKTAATRTAVIDDDFFFMETIALSALHRTFNYSAGLHDWMAQSCAAYVTILQESDLPFGYIEACWPYIRDAQKLEIAKRLAQHHAATYAIAPFKFLTPGVYIAEEISETAGFVKGGLEGIYPGYAPAVYICESLWQNPDPVDFLMTLHHEMTHSMMLQMAGIMMYLDYPRNEKPHPDDSCMTITMSAHKARISSRLHKLYNQQVDEKLCIEQERTFIRSSASSRLKGPSCG